jgi:hypothetical protein
MQALDPLLTLAEERVPPGWRRSVIVFGTAPLALAGLRPGVRDLDLLASEGAFAALVGAGHALDTSRPEAPIVRLADGVEVYRTWVGVGFAEVDAEAREVPGSRGWRVASLGHVLAYKVAAGRPKDADDIALLQRVLG